MRSRLSLIFLCMQVVVVTLFLLPGSWGLKMREVVQPQTARQSLASLALEAQSAISRILGHDVDYYRVIPAETGFRVTNPIQGLQADFTIEGAWIRVGEVEWELALLGYGYSDVLERVMPVQPQARENRVEYVRGDMREWYVNGPLGLQQGFTFLAPVAGFEQAGNSPLTLALGLPRGMQVRLDADGTGLTIAPAGGLAVLRYANLMAYDATGRRLPAWLEMRDAQVLVRVTVTGAAYPIVIDPWVQQAKLTASDGAAGDAFGWSVALSGDTVVVGAPVAHIGANDEQGAAYVFIKPAGGWATITQTAKLTASDGAALDWFGYSVAISGDVVVVGAPGGPTGSPSTVPGSAYVFVRPSGGWADMTQTAKLTAADGALNDRFGVAVAISEDTVVVGAIFDDINANPNQGSAYVFVKPGEGWADMTQTTKLTASDGVAESRFGMSVAMSGDTLVVGAGTHDIGANSSQGSAYVFVKPSGGWADIPETAKLTASDGAAQDLFGWSVAINGDTLVAGAYGDTVGTNNQQGSAYVFVKPVEGWADMTQTAKLTATDGAAVDCFGWAVALNGDAVVVGAFGNDVDVNDDQGSVYVFDKPEGGWVDMTQTSMLIASDGEARDFFGSSVAISEDRLVVGAYVDDVNTPMPGWGEGSVYVFGLDVSEVCVDDDFAGRNPGTPSDGAGCGMGLVFFGSNAFATIQDGVNAVTSGGTVHVAAGTYGDAVDVDSRTGLTISGADKATVVVKPSSTLCWNVGTYGCGRTAAFRVVNSTDVVFQNMTMDFDLVKANQVIGILYWDSTGTVDNNVLKNLSLPDATGGYYEIGSYYRAPGYTAASRAGITISNNTFADTGRLGICTHDYVTATITGNTFYKTADDFGYAIEMGSQSTGVIQDNTIYGYDTPAASDGSNSAGIYIENTFTSGTSGVTKNVLVEDNEVYGCQWALYVGNEFDTYAGDVDIRVTLNDNNFHGNVDGGAAITDEDKEYGSSVSVSGGGNTLDNNGDYGYYIFTAGDGDVTVNLAEEIVTGHDKGVYVEDTGSPSASSYNVAITMSNISDNTTAGIDNTVSGLTLDAECNWWGNLRGPYRPTGNPSGIGNSVSGNVDFQPWLTQAAPSGCDHDGPLTQDVGPATVTVNTPVALIANVGDTGTGGSVLASAEYSLDLGPWAPMQAQDGSFFDDVSEGVIATIPAFTGAGVHAVCVRGTDAAGNTGAAECALLAVYYRIFLPLIVR